MNKKELDIKIKNYLDKNWKQITEDIATLVRIPSSIFDSEFNALYPTGTGAAKAMKASLKIAKRLGFKTKNHENIIGIADLSGKDETQIGFIGHCDVVAPGQGWRFNPYELNIINDYFIGRGVLDDKGPIIIVLHAINFCREIFGELPYSIRFIFGTDEETDWTDVAYYKKNFEQPKIMIAPDGDFPICCGEKGLLKFWVTSKKINNPQILDIWAGDSENAVPGVAHAIIKLNNGWMTTEHSKFAHAIKIVYKENNTVEIISKGRSTHAAEPYEGIDGVAILSQFLLENNIGNKDEQNFLKFLAKIAGKPEGYGLGVKHDVNKYKDLTIVPTVLRIQKGKWKQVFDSRYPGTMSDADLRKLIKRNLPEGSIYDQDEPYPPITYSKDSTIIKTLAKAYETVTKEEAKYFIKGGATYAREFNYGTAFGPAMDWIPKPAWVGEPHGPDEGISIKNLQSSFNIYVYAIKYLMELDLKSDIL